MFRTRNESAFTLIEALTVIAIIGILATLSIIGFRGYQEKTRDARRKNDLTMIQQGFEARKLAKTCNDSNEIGKYPGVSINQNPWKLISSLASFDGCGTFVPNFLSSIPKDPKLLTCGASNTDYRYNLSTTPPAAHYRLAAMLERPSSDEWSNDWLSDNYIRQSQSWADDLGGKGYLNAVCMNGPIYYNYFVGN